MTKEQEPRNERDSESASSPGRRAFVKQGLVLGAGVVGAGCLSDAASQSIRAPSSVSRPRFPQGATQLREDRFDLQVEGRTVPGIVWRPADAGAHTPLVLAGHGGGFGTAGHKRVGRIVALATELAEYGIATAAIDQPGCGDRPGAEEEQARRRTLTIEQAIEFLWTPALVEEMARDWQGSLELLREEWGLGTAGVGYWGLSGGTTFGLPLVALEPRISAAVLGLNSAVPLMLAYAPRITCPVLYTMNLDDDFMSREDALALFDALPAKDKFVLAYPGNHGQNLEAATSPWARFFAERLGAPDTGPGACDVPLAARAFPTG